MTHTPVLALKITQSGVGVYFEPLWYGSALNCHFVYLVIPVTRSVFMRKQNGVVYATTGSKIHIYSNKHETGLACSVLSQLASRSELL